MPLELLDHRGHPVVPAHAQVVALRHVVGQHHTRSGTQPRQHRQQHIALQRLRLVDDDERVVQRATADVGQRQHLEHPAGQDLLQHRRAGQTFQGVEHGLGPWTHLVALTAGQVAQVLPAHGVQRAEDNHLALGAPFQHRLETGAQGQRRLAGAGLAAQRHDAHGFVQQQIERDPLLGGAPAQTEGFAVTADHLHALVGVDAAQSVRVGAQQPDSGVTRQVAGGFEVDVAVGEQPVDVLAGDVQFGHAGPPGGDDVLSVVLVGRQTHRAGLHAQRNVLAHQRDPLALGRQVGRTGQDARVVGLVAEAGRQHRGVTVVELDVQGASVVAHRDRLVETAVLEAQVVEQPQRLPGEPAQFVMVPFGLEFADHDERNHHLVFGEPHDCPGIGQQHRGIEHIGPAISHGTLLGHPCSCDPTRTHPVDTQRPQDRGRSLVVSKSCRNDVDRPDSRAFR